MPFISTIVNFINDALKDGILSGYVPDGRFEGLATTLARPKSAIDRTIVFYPAVMNGSGEYTLVEPNDKYSVILYHRILSNTYSYEQKSFGDQYDIKCITEMNLVVFAKATAAEVLEPAVILGMPTRYVGNGFRYCRITPSSSDMDKVRVFRQEYPSNDYFLKPLNALFLIRYRIEAAFSKDCLTDAL